MDSVKLYTIGCPKCNVLYKKLQKKGIEVTLIEDHKVFKKLGIEDFPIMEVSNSGYLMNFTEANMWVNDYRN